MPPAVGRDGGVPNHAVRISEFRGGIVDIYTCLGGSIRAIADKQNSGYFYFTAK